MGARFGDYLLETGRMRSIEKIIVHCAATREWQDINTDTIRDWHLKRGWSDIGYHYVIELDGTIGIGRPIERSGAHTKGLNSNSIGVCYIGGVETDGKTPKDTLHGKQLESMENLLRGLMAEFPEATLHGHNEFAAKACPSFVVADKFEHLIG